ncbi:MAG: hypothetical protein Q8P24_17840 [Desulfobacterales bacterium]|nr:hypothetical protein [Desulfobacterales bacterium]
METVTHEDKIVALVVRSGDSFPGVTFVTPPEFSQQLGFLKHTAGHVIQPHTHNKVVREVVSTQEVLFIKKGTVKVLLYTQTRALLRELIVRAGDVILLASGGHGFEILEDSEMIEVKQGPYLSDVLDKTKFTLSRPEK